MLHRSTTKVAWIYDVGPISLCRAPCQRVASEERIVTMNDIDPSAATNDVVQRVDWAFSGLSRAIGPMLLVFAITIIGWMVLRGL